MIGKTIAHYKVGAKIGAGGMGEVYRATDTKLNRDVALKVLPELFAKDHDRMARFKREAQLLASLNHPNIAAIYGLEEENGIQAIVLELVEGPTLAERIKQGAIPLEESLNIAMQIAEALESAHEQGVIHRDLKPANVKVKEDGQVKVLDFGLAKALEGEGTAEEIANSPTLSIAATQAGIILGTAAYMSPEQASGMKVDKRADIWSFGVVLYEMLTGERLFTGETVSHILAAVLRAEIGWDALPKNIPSAIHKLLRRCLERDRKRRLQAIGEARIAIEDHLADSAASSMVMAAPAVAATPRWQRWLPWAVVGVFVLATVVLGILVGHYATRAPERPTTKLIVQISEEEPLSGTGGAAMALSPDGRRLAYAAGSGPERKIYVRALDQLDATPLNGTEGARAPFFSPDGDWIAFFTDNSLKKVSVGGGAPLTLCETKDNRGGTWARDGTIVFAANTTSGLSRISAAGGEPEEITTPPEESGSSHRFPHFLPGGKAVLFAVRTGGESFDEGDIALLDLETRETKVLVQGGYYPRYISTGHIVYLREGTLFAVPFDLRRREVTGLAAPLIEGISGNTGNGAAQFAVAENGTLLYLTGAATGARRTAVWVDRNGKEEPMITEAEAFSNPRFSPNGKLLAFDLAPVSGTQNRDVWIHDIARGARTRLTFDAAPDWGPVWTPDGKRVIFSSFRDGKGNLQWKRADGAGEAEQLTEGEHLKVSFAVSPDGRYVSFMEINPETDADLWILDLEGERKAEVFLRTAFNEGGGMFSPEGRWLAYVSDESGRFEIYVRPFPGPGGKWQVSTDGSTDIPHWSPDGSRIYYRNGERIMVVAVSGRGDSFQTGKPEVLFEGTYAGGGRESAYDLSPDGKRFVMLKPDVDAGDESDRRHLTLVFNWFDEVRSRLETAKD